VSQGQQQSPTADTMRLAVCGTQITSFAIQAKRPFEIPIPAQPSLPQSFWQRREFLVYSFACAHIQGGTSENFNSDIYAFISSARRLLSKKLHRS
jgi:hypothetical protein